MSTTAAYSVTNGDTWAASTVPSVAWNSVVYGARKYVATSSATQAAYSTDAGVTWIPITLPAPGNWYVTASQ